MGSKNRLVFRHGDVLTVFTLGTTTNDKIAPPKAKVVQTYHFSRAQYEVAQRKTSMAEFFGHDGAVCMDCPYAMGNGAELKGCYTHKLRQYTGFLSSLRSIGSLAEWDDIPEEIPIDDIVEMCRGRYVRFGTYGEPSLIPFPLVKDICEVAASWTGYTHQWRKPWAYDYGRFFMASTHNDDETATAGTMGWRAFMEHRDDQPRAGMVHCPASIEKDMASNCAKCGLCSGTDGKGTKHVHIFNHS